VEQVRVAPSQVEQQFEEGAVVPSLEEKKEQVGEVP